VNKLKKARMPEGVKTRRGFYSALTRDVLRTHAKVLKVKGRGRMNRLQLQEACIQADTTWAQRHMTAHSQRRTRR